MSRIYYVSTKCKNSECCGTIDEPFTTLFAVNQLKLEPGDQVLLERGSVFRGEYLHLTDQGRKESLISIGAYGEGPLPRIETEG